MRKTHLVLRKDRGGSVRSSGAPDRPTCLGDVGSDVRVEVDRLPVLLPRSSEIRRSCRVGSSVGGSDDSRVVEDADREEFGERKGGSGKGYEGKGRGTETHKT